eukprot:CAMPEP_0202903094 /NCGR_PEP_ID=MMETSP1392-20130828/21308_1 /ASSEMBLY_ACC=CAM_ASM_000868 /TAXON_ID=225041 /ORGANISM="Chlamydomonas chlamydogama, Strain SAG 11-48b" /LENGTH=46 /DNA_ID= /DNA_START= /DNA_END= /DNA_ORIENTATION=
MLIMLPYAIITTPAEQRRSPYIASAQGVGRVGASSVHTTLQTDTAV